MNTGASTLSYQGRPSALIRGLRKCAMAGLVLPRDQAKIQQVLDREAKRAETMRVLNIKAGGGIA